MPEKYELLQTIQATPKRLYEAWLDSKEHSQMTNKDASIKSSEDTTFTTINGRITGENIELEPYYRIVQSWRTVDFPRDSQNSHLEIIFEPNHRGTILELRHSNIPDGQGESCKQEWSKNYFTPMKTYFSRGTKGFVRP